MKDNTKINNLINVSLVAWGKQRINATGGGCCSEVSDGPGHKRCLQLPERQWRHTRQIWAVHNIACPRQQVELRWYCQEKDFFCDWKKVVVHWRKRKPDRRTKWRLAVPEAARTKDHRTQQQYADLEHQCELEVHRLWWGCVRSIIAIIRGWRGRFTSEIGRLKQVLRIASHSYFL